MPFKEFFARFGGSARTKNLRQPGLSEALLPAHSGVPKELIRLCPWEVEFLFCLARRAKAGIVEIGRYYGGSTFLLACANATVPIYSIDIAPLSDAALAGYFQQHGVGKNVRLLVGNSQRDRFEDVQQFDLLFIDGDHSFAGCTADIAAWYGRLQPGGYIVFHDSYLDGEGAQDAILNFVERNDDLQIIASPVIGASYWRYPAGSMACFRKRPRSRFGWL
jgi:predicted O-methyltransferase YrrM